MDIFSKGSDAFFNVISQPEKYKYQIIYTQINRNKHGFADLDRHYFNYDESQFLYPASLVKLPLSVLALQKINDLRFHSVLPFTTMVTDSGWYCETRVSSDFTQKNHMPSIEGYIKKMMLVSDNDAYNRVYEFLGYDYIYESLKKRGLPDVRITQRFAGICDSLSYYTTNPVYFLNGTDTLYKQAGSLARYRLHNPLGEVFMGKGYYDFNHYFNPFPRSFYYNNFIKMDDLESVIERIFFPESFPKAQRFDVPEFYMDLLKKYMGQYPRESRYPEYALPDHFKKYFMIGDGRMKPANSDLRIFNVVGRAYGVLADCAYITDQKSGTEFFLTAIMYCNEDDILNDDSYEYDSVGLPFLAELGTLIYNYERSREKKYKPDLKGLYQLLDSH